MDATGLPRRLRWKADWIEDVDDNELRVARDYSHKWALNLYRSTWPGSFAYFDKALEVVMAVEGECMRRGWEFRDLLASEHA